MIKECKRAASVQEAHLRWTRDRSLVNWNEHVRCQVRANETYSEAKRKFSVRNRNVLINVQSPHMWWFTFQLIVFESNVVVWGSGCFFILNENLTQFLKIHLPPLLQITDRFPLHQLCLRCLILWCEFVSEILRYAVVYSQPPGCFWEGLGTCKNALLCGSNTLQSAL